MANASLIKTQWLYDFLLDSKLVKADKTKVYGREIKPSACQYQQDTSFDVSYTCIIFITDYARELSSLILVINDFLAMHRPNSHAEPVIDTDPLSDDLMDVLITFELSEIHNYIECPQDEAEGTLGDADNLKYVKLDRSKPDELLDLELIKYIPFRPRAGW